MPSDFLVRDATLDDIDTMAFHRAAMFRDMGKLPEALFENMLDASRLYFARAFSEGEYLAWLVSPAEDPARIVAGAGIQLRLALPTLRTDHDGVSVVSGLQGLVVNVYTEPAFRRRGLARLAMQTVLREARERCAAGIVLHAAPEARPLYESLGFVPTNEMRFTPARPS